MKKIIVILSLFLFLSANYQVLAKEYSQADIQRYSTYYSNGMQYMNNAQYSSAIIEFKKVLRFSPYDATTQTSLANAYLARAQYYKQTTRELKKALNDYKSACFYAKYWSTTNQTNTLNQLASSAQKEISDLEKRLNIPQDNTSKFRNAKVLKAQGELAASGYEYQTIKNANKTEAYKNLGNIYKNLNNLMLAMDAYKTAISFDPKNPELHFLYGVMLDEANNFEASMEQYNLALQYGENSVELLEILENKWTQNLVNNPSDAQSYINLGAIYQKQGNFSQAKIQYQKAYQLDPTDDTALLNLASLYNSQKDYASELETYNKLLAKNPKNIEVLNYKANAYKSLNRLDDALSQYDAILAIEPNNKLAKENSDDIVLNNFSGAKLQTYLIQKAKNNPQNYEAQFNCALEMHKNKDLDGALLYYKKAQEINPSKEETYINIAQIYLDKKDYQNANLICQKGLMLNPNSQKLANMVKDIKAYQDNVQYETATKLYETKQYDKAIAKYLEIPNQTKEVKLAIASCYWEMEKYQEANNYYLELLNKEPNNQELLASSAWAYFEQNDFENAKKMAQKLLTIKKNDPDMTNLIAQIEENATSQLLNDAISKYEQGSAQEAINLFNKVLAKKPNDEYSLYYKGLCYDELKKLQEATKQYKMLLSKNPNFKEAYYSLAVDLDNLEDYQGAISNYEKFVSLNQGAKDEMTQFATSRIKELKEYLASLNKK